MDKSLLLVVIFLGAFSIFKVIMFIIYSFIMKPKVDENGNYIRTDKSDRVDKDPFFDDDDNW